MHPDQPPRKRTLLVILDGFGISSSKINNGISAANTPNLDRYFKAFPTTHIEASGHAVGLPDGQMGNSDVGHLTLGAGAIMRQYLVSIDDAIRDGSFYHNGVLKAAIAKAKQAQRPVHLIGLVSTGGVHSHLNHLLALIEMCRREGVRPLLHMITDGRDTAPHSAGEYIDVVNEALNKANGAVASVSGRYYAMDRDQRWERTEAAWQAMVCNKGRQASDLFCAIHEAHEAGESDEFIRPTVLPGAQPLGAQDSVIFFNFRKDRTRQLTAALVQHDFSRFNRGDYRPLEVTCMTNYDPDYHQPYAFVQERPDTTLAEIVSAAGLSQFHCAETEKYAHVTYFFNGGRGECYPREEHKIIPSPDVSTYDLAPEMSAARVADAVVEAMEDQKHAFIVVNFANGDMVGHTAVREAVIKAVETLDEEVGRLLDTAIMEGYAVVLTADHGNCEQLVDEVTGKPHTQHTTNRVPCMIIDQENWVLADGGGLIDIAPTVLQLLGLEKPATMTGHSLLIQVEKSTSSSEAAA